MPAKPPTPEALLRRDWTAAPAAPGMRVDLGGGRSGRLVRISYASDARPIDVPIGLELAVLDPSGHETPERVTYGEIPPRPQNRG